jgi:Glycosyl transferases group 1
MRILISCLQSEKKYPITAFAYWRTYFLKGCEEAGIECIEVPGVDWVEGIVRPPGRELEEWRSRTWQVTLDFVRREHAKKPLDFFLSYFYPQQVELGGVQALQRMGIPCVNFFCDNFRMFRRMPEEFRVFDLNWVPEYQSLGLYRHAGVKYIHAAMPCWVPPEQRTFDHAETMGVTFVGSPDELRLRLMGDAIHAGVEIDIYGMGWKGELAPTLAPTKTVLQLVKNQWHDIRRFGVRSWLLKLDKRLSPLPPPPEIPLERLLGKLSAEDLIRVMQQSTVTLGINRVATPYHSHRSVVTYSRLRDIEAPMMGACYLTEWAEDLEKLYNLGTEIETYRSVDEMKGKLEMLLADKGKRQAMRQKGQARALNDHSVGRTLKRISKLLAV